MKKAFPILLFFSACFLFEDEDENQNTHLTLSEGAIGVTTVRLKVEPEDSLAEFTFELTRDDSTVQTLSLQSDTLIKDTGLNPNTSYTYTGYWMDGTKRIGESNTLTLTTMDTTSHNFTWEIDTLGEYGSYLNDVWIVDENDIWVVGNIETDCMEYNMAHWDGVEWELMGLVSQDEQIGHPGIDPIIENYSSHTLDLNSIHYFSENDIWITSGLPMHWDGNNWTLYHLWNMGVLDNDDGGVTQLWGTSSNNMYFVGRTGSIVHYDGNEFTKMESGTDVDLIDIDGTPDGEPIYIIGRINTGWYSNLVLVYSNNVWNTLYEVDHYLPEDDDFGGVLNTRVLADTAYITTMAGLWKYNYLNQTSVLIPESDYNEGDYFHTTNVTALYSNDIFMVNTTWCTAHFNGLNWNYDDVINQYFGDWNVWSKSADYNGSIFVVVGYVSVPQTALIMRSIMY